MNDQRVAIITGGATGIGFNATKKLVQRGIYCIIASRNIDKLNEAVQAIKNETGRSHVEGKQLDLCDFNSVRNFVEDFKARNLPLHILVNNAGLYVKARRLTECGLESTFVANHLGHFLLTNLLLDKLKESAPARIVVLTSVLHDPSKGPGSRAIITLDTFNFDSIPYDSDAAYRFSKLCNIWFTYFLSEKLQRSGVIINCLQPGFIPETGLLHEYPIIKCMMKLFSRFLSVTRTLDHAGDCVIDLAVNPLITTSGHYYDDKQITPSSERSHNVEEQQRLWDLSAKVVGL